MFSNGLVICFGRATGSNSGSVTISLTIAYITTKYQIFVSQRLGNVATPSASFKNTTSFSACVRNFQGNYCNDDFSYQTIGY